MAGKKKKKSSANPARGFATVSTPSKPKEPASRDDEPPSLVDDSWSSRVDVSKENHAEATTKPGETVSIEEMTPAELEAHLENAELQNAVRLHSSRVRSDALQQVSRLRRERRQLRQQADRAVIYGLSDDLICNVVSMSAQTQPSTTDSNVPAHKIGLEEDDILIKLWLLHDVLKQLGMQSIDEALVNVLRIWRCNGVDSTQHGVCGLNEAFVWYAGSVDSGELPPYEANKTFKADDPPDAVANIVDGSIQGAHTQTDDASAHDVPYMESNTEMLISDHEVTSSDDDTDPDDLVNRWIRMQTEVFERRQRVHSLNPGRLGARDRRLNSKIEAIERDILFDRDAAMHRWRPILRDLEIEFGRMKKLAGGGVIKEELPENKESSEEAPNDEAILGDIFDSPEVESKPQSNIGHVGISMQHDFGSWTGAHPRRLLEEACADIVGREGLKFRSVHSSSFSSRLELILRFRSPNELEETGVRCLPHGVVYETGHQYFVLRMDSIATKNVSQSEAYLATIAVFLLASASLINVKISHRLPKIWKEMLTDLDRSRDELVFNEDVQKLRHLRSILHEPRDANGKDESTSALRTTREKVVSQRTKYKTIVTDPPGLAREKWLQRASSEGFAIMDQGRRELPVYNYKAEILQAFQDNPVLIICADTGAGKSTQIPSYILESKLCDGEDFNILVTQPRRISAISIARRVSSELGEDKEALGTSRSLVGYAIRMESRVSPTTRITFATTGVLLRMLQESANLDQFDCLILDEVHERTMDLDLLFIALKRLQLRRHSLKVVLMSATVDASRFAAYFDNAPVLDLPGRTFPVELGFLEDAIEATLDVELDGQDARDRGPGEYDNDEDRGSTDSDDEQHTSSASTGLEHYSSATRHILAHYNNHRVDYDIILRLATAIATKPKFVAYSNAILIFLPGLAEIRRLHNLMVSSGTFSKGWMVHMLHSSFSTQELEKAFLLPPQGVRKIVLATNIAETGITIPDITAVIDTCKEKVMRFDERRQISRLTEGFIARASARQRKGRAARVQNGLCFHLVTRHHFETKLQEQPIPEMLRLSLQDPILRVKIWGLGSAEETLSAALDPPSLKNIRRAVSKLQDVGAVDSSERLTALGRNLAKIPLDVALGKMAIFGILFQSLDAIVTFIASFSVKSIFVKDLSSKSTPEAAFARGDSDLLTIYNAFSGWKKAHQQGAAHQFCQKYHLNQFQLRQLEEQKVQLLMYLADAGLMALNSNEHAALQNARHNRSKLFMFELPARYDRLSSDTITNTIAAMALFPKLLKRDGQGYRNVYSNQQLHIAPTSINKIVAGKPPEWLCYLEATQTKNGKLNAVYSSRVTQAMIVILLGEADFKYFAGVVEVDHGRMKFSLRRWKEVLALQDLRSQIHRIIRGFLDQPETTLLPADQAWLDVMVKAIEGPSQPGDHFVKRSLQPQRT